MPPPATLDWAEIDTVLLDMDGTLLDLAFDNYFWRHAVPASYARLHDMQIEEAMRALYARYKRVEGRLEWYCLDYWSRELGLDIRALKWEHRHRVRYLPRAPEFLASARARGKRLLLVTNAHEDALAVKVAQTGLNRHVDTMVSSHSLRAPKEDPSYWPALQRTQGFDPERALLIEDSLAVLECARSFGIGAMLAVRQPDSGQPVRTITGFATIHGVADLV